MASWERVSQGWLRTGMESRVSVHRSSLLRKVGLCWSLLTLKATLGASPAQTGGRKEFPQRLVLPHPPDRSPSAWLPPLCSLWVEAGSHYFDIAISLKIQNIIHAYKMEKGEINFKVLSKITVWCLGKLMPSYCFLFSIVGLVLM